MTTSTVTARRKGDRQHYVEGKTINILGKTYLEMETVFKETINFLGIIMFLKMSNEVINFHGEIQIRFMSR